MTSDAFEFGELRSALARGPSRTNFEELAALLELMHDTDPERTREQWVPYALESLERWPSHVRLTPESWLMRLRYEPKFAPLRIARILVMTRDVFHHEHLIALRAHPVFSEIEHFILPRYLPDSWLQRLLADTPNPSFEVHRPSLSKADMYALLACPAYFPIREQSVPLLPFLRSQGEGDSVTIMHDPRDSWFRANMTESLDFIEPRHVSWRGDEPWRFFLALLGVHALGSIRSLDLRSCWLSETHASVLGNMRDLQLEELFLDSLEAETPLRRSQGGLLEFIGLFKQPTLELLTLDWCRVELLVELFEWMAQPTQDTLTRLSLRTIDDTTQGFTYLFERGPFRGVEHLRCTSSSIGPSFARVLESAPNLRHLYLTGSVVMPAVWMERFVELVGATPLETLDFTRTPLGDAALEVLASYGSLEHLRRLGLRNTQVTQRGLDVLLSASWASTLELLDLRGLEVTPPRLSGVRVLHDGLATLDFSTSHWQHEPFWPRGIERWYSHSGFWTG